MSLPFLDRFGSVHAARLKQQGRRFPLCIFRSIFIQWPKLPSGSNTVWNRRPLIVPCTATCPRDGSFLLAFLGKRKMVDLSIVHGIASKRIVDTTVCCLIGRHPFWQSSD